MSTNDRDTHFKNFAKLLMQELLGEAGYIDIHKFWDSDQLPYYEKIIAQRAHDLVRTACIDISDEQMKQGVRLHPNAMLRAVADLDAWPPTTAE